MTNRLYKIAGIVIRAFEIIFKPKFNLKGLEHLCENPTLFVPNHFTRFETLIIPYILYKETKKQVRSLADKGLFVGTLGDFLNKVGTVSTKEPRLNRIIIADLMTGRNDWVIYPEGLMVKNKSVIDDKGDLKIYSPNRIGPPRTGSAILALKAQLIKYFIQKQTKKTIFSDNHLNKYNLDTNELSALDLQIIPINITYYPLRPGKNNLSKMLEKAFDNISDRLKEELKVESQLLFDSDINITFGNLINLRHYTQPLIRSLSILPIPNQYKINIILKLLRRPLTGKFMREIYNNLTINIDHLFAYYIFNIKSEVIDLEHLKYFILRSAYYIRSKQEYNYHASLDINIGKIITDELHPAFEDILAFAIKSKILIDSNNILNINRKSLNFKSDFHFIRIENTLKVIYNELKPIKRLLNTLKKYLTLSKPILKKTISKNIIHLDIQEYEYDYQAYYNKDFSKSIQLGRPFYYHLKKTKIGMVLSHGYKSSPPEINELANYMVDRNVAVYGVRLKGHGTHPRNLQDISWGDWYSSYNRGLRAIRCDYEKIILGGFSTGGVLALLSAAQNPKLVDGVFSINSPLKLQDIKSKLVPAINAWNDLLNLIKVDTGKIEYIDDVPENPDFNYSRNYLKGVLELEKLMTVCKDKLHLIKAPTLVMQAKNDPIVNPKSAGIIYSAIQTTKNLVELDLSDHVIVTKAGKEQVFKTVANFVDGLSS